MHPLPTKKLSLLRHATAISDYGTADFERVLSIEGKKEAHAVGQHMKDESIIPDIVLCSPAKRTQETLECVLESNHITTLESHDILYNGSVGDYLHIVQSISDQYKHILIIAHNPSIYELAVLLAAQGEEAQLQKLTQGYPPATLSTIACACGTWKEIQPVENKLTSIIPPTNHNTSNTPRRWM